MTLSLILILCIENIEFKTSNGRESCTVSMVIENRQSHSLKMTIVSIKESFHPKVN